MEEKDLVQLVREKGICLAGAKKEEIYKLSFGYDTSLFSPEDLSYSVSYYQLFSRFSLTYFLAHRNFKNFYSRLGEYPVACCENFKLVEQVSF